MAIMNQNIGRTGRIIRFSIGVGCAFAAALVWLFTQILWLTLVLAFSAAFTLFEASRGWCALRACKIKTPF